MRALFKVTTVILIFVLIMLFNAGLIDLRIREMSYFLGRLSVQHASSKTMGIVAKYELIKRRMLYGEEHTENYELEARIQALTSGDSFEKDDGNAFQGVYLVPVRLVVNSIRVLMGKEIINPKEDDRIYHILEIGYFWERNRKYREAIDIYNSILEKTDIQPELRAAVLLHKSFCHSMMSEYGVSKKIYENVISEFPNTEAGMLSWKLLDFIETMEEERKKVEDQASVSGLEKARQFYLLMDYRNAIKYLSAFLQGRRPVSEEVEARFYKGRSHEELGETQEAMAEYNRIIRDDEGRRWAKQANRRMLMLGEFYESKKQVAEEARKRLGAYQDMMFADKVDHYASLVSASSLRDELLQEAKKVAPGRSDASTDSMLALINRIGDLDLTGEKEREKLARIEELKRELMKSGELTAPQVRELERRSALAVNPYRRPGAIKKVIDDNTNELRYIYNKKLRSGVTLSGKMLVTIQIDARGNVANAEVSRSDMGDKTFEKEVVDKIAKWRFKAVPDSLGNLTVNYPFEFYKEN